MYVRFLRLQSRTRVFFMIVLLVILFSIFVSLKCPEVILIADLDRCPVCYGASVCSELYSNQIILEKSLINKSNMYYGHTKSNSRIVLKKLAQDWEFEKFDSKLCKTWELKDDCKLNDGLNLTVIINKIKNMVHLTFEWPEPRNKLVFCPYTAGILDFINDKKLTQSKSDLLNIWTILSINPEPLILKVIPRSNGWPVPSYIGECGRLVVESHEGEPLSSLLHAPWHRKLKYAEKIVDAALDFTFKHNRYRFYLMDWSLNNIVVNEQDDIAFVDLEDVVVLDTHIFPRNDLPYWYQRTHCVYMRENKSSGFSFSIENMCAHHLSDHNLWAACYILAGDNNSLLYPIPQDDTSYGPYIFKFLESCLRGSEDRFSSIKKLQSALKEILQEEKKLLLARGLSTIIRK